MARYNGGWIKVYREVIQTDIAKHPVRISLFIHLIAMANIEETWVQWGDKPRKCPRGSLVTSYRELAKIVGADTKSIERQLRYLALRDTICLESDTRGSFITIKNYCEYQDKKEKVSHDEGHDRHITADTVGDTVGDYNEEIKNIRNKEYKNSSCTVTNELAPEPKAPKKSSTLTLVTFNSETDLANSLPRKQIERWAALYSDQEFIRRELIKAFGYYENNPTKRPKTVRGWIRALSSWFERGWPRHVSGIKGDNSVSELTVESVFGKEHVQ